MIPSDQPAAASSPSGQSPVTGPRADASMALPFKSYGTGTTDWAWEIDLDGRLVRLSDGVTAVLGFPVVEMLGKTPFEFCEPAEKARLEMIFNEVRAAAVPFTGVEQTALHRDGHGVVLTSCGTPVFDKDEKLTGFRGVTRDETRRKAAEQALRTSEALLKESQRIASVGHYTFSVATGLWTSSEVLDEIFGIAGDYRRDVEGWINLVYSEDRTAMQRYLAEHVVRDGQVFDREYRIVRPSDREVRWVYGRGALEKDAASRVVALIGTIQDITARKRTELALAESEHRFRLVLEATKDGLWDWHVDTNQVYFSDACSTMLGYVPGEIPANFSSWLELLPKDERAAVLARANDCIENRCEDYAGEFRMRTKSGGWRWVLGRGKAVARDVQGRATRLVGTLSDLSERRQLEEQLRQAQKLEAVGQLAGGIAHDFNNILAAMALQLGLLTAKPGLDEEMREGLGELEKATARAAGLTRQLLMFSRRSVLQVHALDLNEVIANLLKMLGRLIGEDIELRFEPGPALPQIEADEGMVEQVLMNLAVNARDAMPASGRLTIRTEKVAPGETPNGAKLNRQPGPFVRLSVVDTGCGMDATTRKRLFEPFFTTKEVGRGTGLGLATVHGIVAQHHGWIEVESEPGQGSRFTVFWPALTGEPGPRAPQPKPDALPRGKETILVVEDEAGVRRTIVACLQRLGYRVIEAADGDEAVELSRRYEIDLLFTDMIMPKGMSGMDLAAKLRATRPALRIIVSSGYAPELARRSAVVQNGIMYLPKPYEFAVLGATVRECLDRGKRA